MVEKPVEKPVEEQDEEPVEVPVEPPRGRDLTRGPRRPRRTPADTGRHHHLGAAPADMPVLGEGRTTRTTAVQLASRTDLELARLATVITAEMTAAALDQDFESAAWYRDELARVTAAQQARAGGE